MKKFTTIASSLLLFAGALISCQKENLVEPQTVAGPTSFTATLEQNTDPQTKVTIDGYTPKFEVGDELTVMASNSAIATFAVSEVSAAGEATFELKGSWSSSPAAPYTIYNGKPSMSNSNMLAYSAPNTISSAKAMKLDQAIVVGSASELNNVVLKNMCSVIKIVVPDEVKAIKVAPSSGTLWDGAAIMLQTLTASQFPTANAKEITYTGAGETLVAGTYYIPFFPQQFTGGVMVGYTLDGTEYYWKEKKGNFIFQRNKLYDMGSLANWPQPEPKFAVEDLVGTFVGDIKIGNVYNGTFQGNTFTGVETVVEISDNSSKGNVKFTKFVNRDNSFYANFDLVVGTITIPAGETLTYDVAASVTLSSNLELSLDEETKSNLSNSSYTVLGPHPSMGSYGFSIAVDPFTLTKQAAPEPEPEGPTVADIIGNYTGGCYEEGFMGSMALGKYDYTKPENFKDFSFEAGLSENKIILKKYYDSVVSGTVEGTFDPDALTLTFPEGITLPIISGDVSLTSELKFNISDDLRTMTQDGVTAATRGPITYNVSQIVLTKKDAPAPTKPFPLEEFIGTQWTVSYAVENSPSAVRTAEYAMSIASSPRAGYNVYINNFLGNNANNWVYGKFDEETGILTIDAGGSYYIGINTYPDTRDRGLDSEMKLQLSQDHKSLSCPTAPSFSMQSEMQGYQKTYTLYYFNATKN